VDTPSAVVSCFPERLVAYHHLQYQYSGGQNFMTPPLLWRGSSCLYAYSMKRTVLMYLSVLKPNLETEFKTD